jgi:hypothetical protein
MNDKPALLRPTDDDAIRQARMLLRSARFGALAVIDPASGFPFASRVLIGTDIDACPVILVSGLSTHTRGLMADPRCSLLAGEPGKGDPLAWPRITMLARAEKVERENPAHATIRQRFLNRHPKAGLYADFGDFAFFRLVPDSASLNGGFGKAYGIEGRDLIIDSSLSSRFSERTRELRAAMQPSEITLATYLARIHFSENIGKWTISNFDPDGVDLSYKDKLRRFEFTKTPTCHEEFLSLYFNCLNEMP